MDVGSPGNASVMVKPMQASEAGKVEIGNVGDADDVGDEVDCASVGDEVIRMPAMRMPTRADSSRVVDKVVFVPAMRLPQR